MTNNCHFRSLLFIVGKPDLYVHIYSISKASQQFLILQEKLKLDRDFFTNIFGHFKYNLRVSCRIICNAVAVAQMRS